MGEIAGGKSERRPCASIFAHQRARFRAFNGDLKLEKVGLPISLLIGGAALKPQSGTEDFFWVIPIRCKAKSSGINNVQGAFRSFTRTG